MDLFLILCVFVLFILFTFFFFWWGGGGGGGGGGRGCAGPDSQHGIKFHSTGSLCCLDHLL